jgi:hypothetical protein
MPVKTGIQIQILDSGFRQDDDEVVVRRKTLK